MGRYRAPQPKSSPYITRPGFERLQKESKALWELRAEVTVHVTAAAAEGDRSENAEYIYRKKQLREIDGRIRYLQKRLPDLTIVDGHGNDDQIFFGATVKLENEEGEEMTVRIVGSDEIDPNLQHISVDSPLAKAIIKKSVDDEATIEVLGVRTTYTIVEIKY